MLPAARFFSFLGDVMSGVVYSLEYFGLPEPFDAKMIKKELRFDAMVRELYHRMIERTFVQGKMITRNRAERKAKMKYSTKPMSMREDGRAVIRINRARKRRTRKYAGFRAKWLRRMKPRGGVKMGGKPPGVRLRSFTS